VAAAEDAAMVLELEIVGGGGEGGGKEQAKETKLAGEE